MIQKCTENTLFLGNGFTRALFPEMPAWNDLFGDEAKAISDNTVRYETHRLGVETKKIAEDEIKSALIANINKAFTCESLAGNIRELKKFGVNLKDCKIGNIITTNYDSGIEFILGLCGYEKKDPKDLVPEEIYSIRTYKEYYNKCIRHRIKLWKIHGDLERIKSVTLGFDQYCGSLSKLVQYIKGEYKSSKNCANAECSIPMKDKCQNPNLFDGISWAELFFCTNIFIVGFGMAFAEIDIWWLLNKRARYQVEFAGINNAVTFLYNTEFDKPDEKQDIFTALSAFGVEQKPIHPGPEYLINIFAAIKSCTGSQ